MTGTINNFIKLIETYGSPCNVGHILIFSAFECETACVC
jgi:hypothetical protein